MHRQIENRVRTGIGRESGVAMVTNESNLSSVSIPLIEAQNRNITRRAELVTLFQRTKLHRTDNARTQIRMVPNRSTPSTFKTGSMPGAICSFIILMLAHIQSSAISVH